MKICQIATIGENFEWILKGLINFRVNKLILISNSDPTYLKKIDEINKRLLDPEFETEPLDVEVIIIESDDPLEFVDKFKCTILDNFEDGYQIDINATAGLRIWQLLSYFVIIQLEEFVNNYFIIDKRSGKPIILPSRILSKSEQIILESIGKDKRNIDEIKTNYEKFKGKAVSRSLISKYLVELKMKKLLIESKNKKFKIFKTCELGKIYLNPVDYYKY